MNCDLGLRLVGGEGKTVRAQSWCQVSLTPHLQVRRERLRGGGHSGQSEVGSGSGGSALNPTAPFSPVFHCSAQTPLQCGFSKGPLTLFSEVLEGGTILHPFLASLMGLSLGAGASRSAQLLKSVAHAVRATGSPARDCRHSLSGPPGRKVECMSPPSLLGVPG